MTFYERIGEGSTGLVYLFPETNRIEKRMILFQEWKDTTESTQPYLIEFVLCANALRELVFYKWLSRHPHIVSSNYGLSNRLPDSLPSSTDIRLGPSSTCIIEQPFLGHPISPSRFENNLDLISTLLFPIAEVIHCLHQCGFSHGDIKLNNIVANSLLTESYVIDFGSLCFSSLFSRASPRCTITTVAPEELLTKNSHSSLQSDIYSFGCVLFELFTKRVWILSLMKTRQYLSQAIQDSRLRLIQPTLHMELNEVQQHQESLYKEVYSLYASCTETDIEQTLKRYISCPLFLSLLVKCLCLDPKRRYTSFNLLSDPFWKQQSSIKSIPLPMSIKEELISVSNVCDRDQIEHRRQTLVYMKDLCRIYGTDLFSHSVMLFDRLVFRNNELVLYHLLYSKLFAIMAVLLSRTILKDEDCCSQELNVLVPSVSVSELKDFCVDVIKELDFQLFNASPDIILYKRNEWNTTITNDDLLQLYTSYLVLHQTANLLAEKIKKKEFQ